MSADDTGKRVKRVEVTRQYVADLFKEGVRVVDGLPDDAECVSLAKDHDRDLMVLTIRYDDWPVVEEGEDIPVTTPEFRRRGDAASNPIERVEIADRFIRDHATTAEDAESFVHIGHDPEYHPAGGYWFPCSQQWDDSDSGWAGSLDDIPNGEVVQYPLDDRLPEVLGQDDLPEWVIDRNISGGGSE